MAENSSNRHNKREKKYRKHQQEYRSNDSVSDENEAPVHRISTFLNKSPDEIEQEAKEKELRATKLQYFLL